MQHIDIILSLSLSLSLSLCRLWKANIWQLLHFCPRGEPCHSRLKYQVNGGTHGHGLDFRELGRIFPKDISKSVIYGSQYIHFFGKQKTGVLVPHHAEEELSLEESDVNGVMVNTMKI